MNEPERPADAAAPDVAATGHDRPPESGLSNPPEGVAGVAGRDLDFAYNVVQSGAMRRVENVVGVRQQRAASNLAGSAARSTMDPSHSPAFWQNMSREMRNIGPELVKVILQEVMTHFVLSPRSGG
jgi:hypothetical protein